jgi:hypothetical protein
MSKQIRDRKTSKDQQQQGSGKSRQQQGGGPEEFLNNQGDSREQDHDQETAEKHRLDRDSCA